ncbi:hypothetical protein [Citrobacter braakii]
MLGQGNLARKDKLLYILIILLYFIQPGSIIVERFFLPMLGAALFISCFIIGLIKIPNQRNSELLSTYLFCTTFFICISVSANTYYGAIFDSVKIFFCLVSFYIGYFIFSQVINKNDARAISFVIFIASTIFLLFEFYFRVYKAFGFNLSVSNFYILKVDSLFFFDSNGTGIYILCLLCYFVTLWEKLNSEKYIYIAITCLFQLGTFSRAAILSSVLVFICYIFIRSNTLTRFILISLASLLLLVGTSTVLTTMAHDGSGETKLLIFSRMTELYFANSLSEQLFGFGIELGNFAYSYLEGSYAHALIPMLLGEVGLIGLFAYLAFWLWWALRINTLVIIVFVPFFILGISYLPPFNETYFFVGGIAASQLIRREGTYVE